MSLSVLLVAALAIFSRLSVEAKRPPPPSPSPAPPRPIFPTCGMFVAFTLVKGNLSRSSIKDNSICHKFAKLMNAHYSTPFNWSCNVITTTGKLQQAKGIEAFIKLLKRNTDAQAILSKLGGSCGDTLSLTTSCPNVDSVIIKRCQASPPPPGVSLCNLTVSLNRAMGGLTRGQCGSLGDTVNTLYGTRFLFACDGLQYSNTEMSTTAANNYNAGKTIGDFLLATKTKTNVSKRLLSIYGLTCGIDSVVVTSGPLYAPCAGTATINFPC